MSPTSDSEDPLEQFRKTFEENAKALGLACIAWSGLESKVDEFLVELIPLPRGNTEGIVTSAIDFRAKLKMLVNLAFENKYSDLWFLEIQTLVNRIDNELRPERNRYVHDTWVIETNETDVAIMRLTKAARLRKPKSFELELVTETKRRIDQAELASLSERISAATWELWELHKEFLKADEAALYGGDDTSS